VRQRREKESYNNRTQWADDKLSAVVFLAFSVMVFNIKYILSVHEFLVVVRKTRMVNTQCFLLETILLQIYFSVYQGKR